MRRYCLAKKCKWAVGFGEKLWLCPFGECPYGYSFQFVKGKKVYDRKKEVKHSQNYIDLCHLIGLEP